MTESPELAAAMPLLDAAKDWGFTFEWITVGQDAPLGGVWESTGWLDEVYVGGLFSGCSAARRRRSSLIVPGDLPVTERLSGDALEALHTVVDGRTDECCAITLEAGTVTPCRPRSLSCAAADHPGRQVVSAVCGHHPRAGDPTAGWPPVELSPDSTLPAASRSLPLVTTPTGGPAATGSPSPGGTRSPLRAGEKEVNHD